MLQEAIFHMSDSRYCFAADAHTVALRLRVARGEKLDKAYVVYAGKYEFAKKQLRAEMAKAYTDKLFDYYTAYIPLADVRFVYVFELVSEGKAYYFSEDGLSDFYDYSLGYYNSFQLPYINSADVLHVVDWMRSAVFYQIFVDRFCRGDYRKDARYINLKWGEIPTPKSFAGGDLAGITEKLPYLKGLGVNALYLTPIFRSVSNHKYDIASYREIDPQFGTEKDFQRLVEEAHAKGIRVVLDAVFNHCSERLPQFQDVVKNGKKSRYYKWFMIDGDRPDREKANYECFASCAYMPKFNTSEPEVQAFLIDTALFWMRKYRIDGWRLDVSDEVSHDFWRAFRRAVKAENAEAVIIGENWHDAYAYLQGDQYDGIMNYAFTKACLDFYAFGRFDAAGFGEKLSEILMRNTDNVNAMMLNLLDSHDTHRFLTQAGGDKDKLLSALAVNVLFPGAPCIYYGTELAMEGGYDPDCRRTFDWEKAENDTEVSRVLKELAALRARPELQSGEARFAVTNGMFTLKRSLLETEIVLFANRTGKPAELPRGCKALVCSRVEGSVILPEGFAVCEVGK